jgi:hypothetical protein
MKVYELRLSELLPNDDIVPLNSKTNLRMKISARAIRRSQAKGNDRHLFARGGKK